MKVSGISHINGKNFCRYGQVLSMPRENGSGPQAAADTVIYHGVLGLMDCAGPMQVGMYYSEDKSRTISQLEQHQGTQEFLLAVEGAFIIPAATSCEENGKRCPNMEDIAVFLVRQGEGLIFDKGIWHTSPIPAGESCTVMVAFKHNTPAKDVILYDCDDGPYEFVAGE